MDPWFERREVGDVLVRITEPHVNQILKANVWWIRGADGN